jgi:hypothetical protein
MTHVDPPWSAEQQRRWMRPNAHLYLRPDAYRFMPPGAPRYYGKDVVRYFRPQPADAEPHTARADASIVTTASRFHAERAREERARERALLADRQELLRLKSDLLLLRIELKFRQLLRQLLRDHKAGFRPDQPRWPAGSGRISGRWSGGAGTGGPVIDPQPTRAWPTLTDQTPDDSWKPGAQYAQGPSRGRGGRGPIIINGRLVEPSPAQAARLTIAEAQARDAVRRVQEVDPTWRPPHSSYESVEGLIRAYEADAQAAQARIKELQHFGIVPGTYARESLPARGSDRDFMATERSKINQIGSATGCHTCGTRNPGTSSGNFIPDHQPPSAVNFYGRAQRLYPQCLTCSLRQGGWIRARGQNR